MRRALLIVVASWVAGGASVWDAPNPSLLRDAIEIHESGGGMSCGEAVGENGELGCFQIKPTTREAAGCGGKNSDLMTNYAFARLCAWKVLMTCSAKARERVFTWAYCYNQGPNTRRLYPLKDSRAWRYCWKVMMEYQRRVFEEAKRR